MPATAVIRQSPAALLTAAAVPLALAVADGIRLRRRLAAASRDRLTGALRRESWTPRAQRLLDRHHDQAVVLICDLDHFKQINDRLGHGAGDRVLAETTTRLTDWAGARGLVGRLGGDEFAVLTLIDPRHRQLRLAHLIRLLATPVTTDTGPVDVAASIGAASPDLLGTTDLSVLQRAADAAMYAGKHTGRAVLADHSHAVVPSVNGRRAGRPGTSVWGQAA
ncbi:GGDEF domain-containing protein [Streptomyces sp. NPDC059578]|uniref:GGDEF domain-containing protein n=1 Tax=Streptomyces sp. NPDC059578 TaxID=3346874 RepID=UPI0036BC3531